MSDHLRFVQILRLLSVVGIVSLFSGCALMHANYASINRSTPLGEDGNKAVHLDAQQRLVVFKGVEKFCAEPSPDAITALSSKFKGKIPKKLGNIDFSSEAGNAVASIVRRTQSIMLMRDSAYRICEAFMNEALTKKDAKELLERNQEFMVVVLAIAQLTGAVSDQQIALQPSASTQCAYELVEKPAEDETKRKDEETGNNQCSYKHTEQSNSDICPSMFMTDREQGEQCEKNRNIAMSEMKVASEAVASQPTPVASRYGSEATKEVADAVTELVKLALKPDKTSEGTVQDDTEEYTQTGSQAKSNQP